MHFCLRLTQFTLACLMLSPFTSEAGEFFDMTRAAFSRHAFHTGVDLAAADARTFGVQVEKHGSQARIGIFDVSRGGDLLTHLYGCQFDQMATCWKQKVLPPFSYRGGSASYSAALQINAVGEVIESLKSSGVDPEKFSLLKIWQSPGVIHLRIGFEAGVVEINYDCFPTKQKMCRPAAVFPENEP